MSDPHTFTAIPLEDGQTIFTCNDCGAYGPTIPLIPHHKTCVPGNALAWERHYSEETAEQT